MFVASGLYRYATGTGNTSASTSSSHEPTPSHSRVKRRPTVRRAGKSSLSPSTPLSTADVAVATEDESLPKSPPPSYASVASGTTEDEKTQANAAKKAVIETLLAEEDLYKLLGVKRNAAADEIRRGFLNRSRSCHPDKFPNYPPATTAFQKVSFAYETLSKPSSRRMYDVSGRSDFAAAMNTDASTSGGPNGLNDDTLNGVLYSVLCEFMEGDFEMIRVLVNALNEGNPSMNLGDEAVDSIESAFRRLREILLAGKRYLSVIKFELMRLYEIQQSLRSLSYFNLTGRLKLTLQLARITINIPLAIDTAMKQQQQQQQQQQNGQGEEELASGQDVGGQDEDSSSDEEEEDEGIRRPFSTNSRAANASHHNQEDFGVASEGSEDSEDDRCSEEAAERRNRQRRKARRARARAAKREQRAKIRTRRPGEALDEENDEGAARSGSSTRRRKRDQEELAVQRRGLLPNAAVGLLKGVVKVLETSEAWVPGKTSKTVD